MARPITRDRKLTPEEAAKDRKIREEVELEKPEIIAQARRTRREARRKLPSRREVLAIGAMALADAVAAGNSLARQAEQDTERSSITACDVFVYGSTPGADAVSCSRARRTMPAG